MAAIPSILSWDITEPDRRNPSVKSGLIHAPDVASACRAEPPFGAAKGREKGNAKSGQTRMVSRTPVELQRKLPSD
jgi:hypothetical protein